MEWGREGGTHFFTNRDDDDDYNENDDDDEENEVLQPSKALYIAPGLVLQQPAMYSTLKFYYNLLCTLLFF